jgi:hypothetical protein
VPNIQGRARMLAATLTGAWTVEQVAQVEGHESDDGDAGRDEHARRLPGSTVDGPLFGALAPRP